MDLAPSNSLLASLLQPSSPFVSPGILGFMGDLTGKTIQIGLSTLQMTMMGMGSFHKVLTPMRLVGSFFYPPFLLMAMERVATTGYQAAVTLPSFRWFLPKATGGASAALNSGEVQAARSLLNENEKVFWKNASPALRTHQQSIKQVFGAQGVTAHQIQRWASGGYSAENLTSFRAACQMTGWNPNDATIQTLLAALNGDNNANFGAYLSSKHSLESALLKFGAKERAFADTGSARPEGKQVGDHRFTLKGASIGLGKAMAIASVFALAALATQAAVTYGTNGNFASQIMGMTSVDDANAFCNAEAASSMIGNIPLFSSVLSMGYHGTQWVLSVAGPVMGGMQIAGAFAQGGWRQGLTTSLYSLTAATYGNLLPASVASVIGDVGRKVIFGAFGLRAIPHVLGCLGQAGAAMAKDDFQGYMSHLIRMTEPIQIGMMIAGAQNYASTLSSGLAVLARSVTRGFNCAILAHLTPA